MKTRNRGYATFIATSAFALLGLTGCSIGGLLPTTTVTETVAGPTVTLSSEPEPAVTVTISPEPEATATSTAEPTSTATGMVLDPLPEGDPTAIIATVVPSAVASGDPTAIGATVVPATPTPGSPSAAIQVVVGRDKNWINPDRTFGSKWYMGFRNVSIHFGCVDFRFYKAAEGCGHGANIGRQMGVHHGVDIKMPVGTPVYSGVDGVVLSQKDPGTPGTLYGKNVFRIQFTDADGVLKDVVIGHTSKNFVTSGQRVTVGMHIADSGKEALDADDPPHVHIELRPAGKKYEFAECPYALVWGTGTYVPLCAP